MLRVAVLGTAKRNTATKRKIMLRFVSPHLRFESDALNIIITICVNLLRFPLRFYVLGNVRFCGSTARSLHKLYVAYNNAFSMMHHLPTYCRASDMFRVNRVPNCAAVIRNLSFRFMSRLDLSSDALVCSIIDSDLKFVSRIRLHWMNMLYVHISGG